MEYVELHLDILRVCKQTHERATKILWATNFFSLGSMHMLLSKVGGLPHAFSIHIRHIHVDSFGPNGLHECLPRFIRDKRCDNNEGFFEQDTGPWSWVMRWMKRFKPLKNLRTMHLTLETPVKENSNQDQIIYILLLKSTIWNDLQVQIGRRKPYRDNGYHFDTLKDEVQRQVDKGYRFSLKNRKIWCERGEAHPIQDFWDTFDLPLAPEELAYASHLPSPD